MRRYGVRQRAPAALVLLVGTAITFAACGGSGAGSQLSRRLLSATDLPAGWSAVTAASTAPKTRGACFASLPRKPRGWTYQTASFAENGAALPNFGEVLASGRGVAATWTRLARALTACRAVQVVTHRATIRATIRKLALPRVGTGLSADAWSFSVAGVQIGVDLIVFRVGRYGAYLSYSDLGAPNASIVTAFARAAAAKARRGSTAPVSDSISITSAPLRIAQTARGAVAYRTLGSGPPLLLITGYDGTMESWDRRFVDTLAQQYRVVILNNSGIGGTTAVRAPLTIDAMADQTSALIGALHLGRTAVLGWSMGSMIAQALAVRHPDQLSRVLLCASYPGNGTAVQPAHAQLRAFESGPRQKVMAALFPTGQSAAADTYLAAVSSYPPEAPVPEGVLSAQRKAIDSWWNGSDGAGRAVARIALPTLVADGTEDRLDPSANSRALAALIPGAQLYLYAGAGHAFLFQDEASFVPLVEAFLR